MPFTRVNPGDLIQAQNLNQVIGSLNGTSGQGVPIAQVSVNDATNYALSLQNLEATNSRAVNIVKSDGSLLIRADATGVSLGTPLNLPANSVNTAAIANNAVTNAKLGTDTARLNLLTNGGFEIWQRGTSFATTGAYTADRWVMTVAGTDAFSVNKNTANADTANGSLTCAWLSFTLGTGAGGTYLSQTLRHTDGPGLAGRTVTASVRVNTSLANAIRIGIGSDAGGTTVYSAFHPGGSTYQTLTVTFTVPAAATFTQLAIFLSGGTTQAFYVDNAMLVVGSVPADYAPLHPADDLARCNRYYELLGNSGDGSILWAAWAGAASEAIGGFIRCQVPKAVTPTVTKVGTWQVTNCAQPTAASGSTDGCQLYALSTASGHTQWSNSGAGA